MSRTLLISTGNGPGECELAAGHVLTHLLVEVEAAGIDADVTEVAGRHGPKSVLVTLHGPAAKGLAEGWLGTVLWRCPSPLRPGHKRQNWFIGVFALPPARPAPPDHAEIRFDTFRAGGPGGQHQNTTDSAVRATCPATGLSVVVRDGRSQHRNKALARERLAALKQAQAALNSAARQQELHRLHATLERGTPTRRFSGPRFRET
ncbi:peptide chain release factor H [Aliiroseovarius sp.]|uniref:peptide chain release factor H n=1 Tax=Aliiroseovarius sp. TaxID=1872442 RepID=UPI003BABCEAC